MHTILVVDDDQHIRDVIRFALEQAGMRVIEAADGAQALGLFRETSPDLLILDIMMPEMDGLSVCRELRKSSEAPILFLSSRTDEIDRVLGLEMGGDDYVTKPFSPRELVARVNAIFRRLHKPQPEEAPGETLQRGALALDCESHTAHWDGREVTLTATEFTLLKTLLKRPKKVFTRDEIMELAYEHSVSVSDRTIDSHVRGVRTKFSAVGGESVIETVHGVGYKLGSCQA